MVAIQTRKGTNKYETYLRYFELKKMYDAIKYHSDMETIYIKSYN